MKTITFTLLFTLLTGLLLAQQNLIGWDFSDDPPDAYPTAFLIADDSLNALQAEGTSEISFKNGYADKAAQATGWDAGAGTKYWMVEFNATSHGDMTITSRQQSGGEEPGPRDWKIQYSIGETGAWTDVEEGSYMIDNDWETGYIDGLALPEACNFQPLVRIRWVITSDTSSSGEITLPGGKSKIDDILVMAYSVSGTDHPSSPEMVTAWPNPATHEIRVSQELNGFNYLVVDVAGRTWDSGIIAGSGQVGISHIPAGIYTVIFTREAERKAARIIKQ